MMTWEGNGRGDNTAHEDTQFDIDREYPISPPTSPAHKRFIVEPQVLNAAFEFELGERRGSAPSLPVPGGGLPPPPRGLPPPPRSNSRRGKPINPSSTPSSPTASLNNSIASVPNSPTSSPYSNSPNTPGSSEPGLNVKPSPRLSNLLRGESLIFSAHRRSSTDPDGLYDQREDENEGSQSAHQWTSHYMGESFSPLDSVPSSPERGTPADGSRPSRQNRYLSGLQKIKKLGGKATGILSDAGVRSTRRMSDADLDSGRSNQIQEAHKGSVDLTGRYRRMLEAAGVSKAGEQMRPPTSVPGSPIAPAPDVKSIQDEGGRSLTVGERVVGGFRRPSFGAPPSQSAKAQTVPRSSARGTGQQAQQVQNARSRAAGEGHAPPKLQPPPRGWGSHARQPSDMSTTSSLASASRSLSPSDSAHDTPSSLADARISISSTIYPSSSNNHSFDIARYPSQPGRSSMSADRESFIDLSSPTFSPLSPEFQQNTIPQKAQSMLRTEQPTHTTSRDDTNDFNHGQSTSSRSTKPRLPHIIPPAGPEKPPIPTTPKPDFSHRSLTVQSNAKASNASPAQGQHGSPLSNFASDVDRSLSGLTTTNALTPRERAARVRTTHKLTKVFGQTPGVSPVSPAAHNAHLHPNGCMPIPGNLTLNLTAKRKHHHHRPAVSMSEEVVTPAAGEAAWPPPEGTRYVSLASRRHSAPMSPDEFSFMVGRRSHESGSSSAFSSAPDGSSVIEIGTAEGVPGSGSESGRWTEGSGEGPGSPTSFMDLSDEEGAHDADGLSEILAETPRGPRTRRDPLGLGLGLGLSAAEAEAALSDSVSLSSEQLAEDERRRKREKLAKLHRFLGSRVPQHLVLGTLDEGTPLPPPAQDTYAHPEDDADVRKAKMRRRRSSSAAEFTRTWSDDIDRLKEELNEHEKAINVRRAIKMEKMFGVAPPQTLYHTRAPTSSSSSLSANAQTSSPRVPPRSPSSPAFRFTPSASALVSGAKPKKKGGRPGTSDSSRPLMGESPEPGLLDPMRSSVYMHYRHSLNSLNDIIDRDDRESLAELHDYLSGHQFDLTGPPSPLVEDVPVASPTVKAERRRSLPSRTSIASFTSEISMIIASTPTEGSFQQRRRRAAKLTHFFGVDYRELMNEVLESIEKGLEEERGRGTLRPDEVKDLQQKLVSLKTKRNSLRQ